MDSNAIDLEELDKSDISSDWNSSEDEAPAMVVENEEDTTENSAAQPIDYAQAEKEVIDMDSEGDNEDVIPATEHEILPTTIEVEEIINDLPNNAILVSAGVVSNVMEDSCIVNAGQNAKAIEENTILYRDDLNAVGRVIEVFGQVEHPFYLVKWPKTMPNPQFQVGERLKVNMTTLHYILPGQLNSIGTDASNVYDEEPNEKERVMIECTEDVKGEEVVDESGAINYQQDYVIPSQPIPHPVPHSMMMMSPPPVAPLDQSGLDILRNSYF